MRSLRIKIPLILFLAVISITSSAQNWNFIKPNERYHFKHKGDTIPLNTILIDSTAVVGSDSVFYLNRLFLACDTCSTEGFYLDNQPGFLQREFILSQVSSTVQLNNPEKYTINLPNNNEKEWWFDEAKTQKAILVSVEEGEIFGVQDSIATININGEPQIKIAKNLGLLQYFDYELSGLENAGLGICLPGFKEFYDFKVGDVFQYQVGYGGGEGSITYLQKKGVLSIEYFNDSLRIKYQVIQRNGIYLYADIEQYDEVKTYHNLKNHLSNCYPLQSVPIYSYEFDEYLENRSEDHYERLSSTFVKVLQVNGKLIKSMGYSWSNPNQNGLIEVEPGIYKETWDANPMQWFWRFEEGLGVTHGQWMEFESSSGEVLLGYIKNGIDTTGVVYNDYYTNLFNTIGKVPLCAMIQVIPNPSKGEITFDLGTENEAKIKIYTLEGRLVEQFETKSNQTQNLQHLNSGIYIISIQLKEGLQQLKWIKQ